MPFAFFHKYDNSAKFKSISTELEDIGKRNTQIQKISIRDNIYYIGNTNQAYVIDEIQEEAVNDDYDEEENVKQKMGLTKNKLNKLFSRLYSFLFKSPTMNIIFQDLPYLVIRILVIAHRGEINFTTSGTVLFGGKNILVILLECYKMKLHHIFLRLIKKMWKKRVSPKP